MAQTDRPSRRGFLGMGIAGALALVAQALSRPATAEAADGDPLIAGNLNLASSPTRLSSSGADAALEATTTNGAGWAVKASSTDYPAVFATSTGNAGLYGVGNGANGAVLGQNGGTGPGVMGTAGVNHPGAPDYSGIYGYGNRGVVGQGSSSGFVGVQGFVGDADAPTPGPVKFSLPTGAYGEASGDSPTGVWGFGGVAAAGSSTGVYGEGDTGVWGFGGWGVFGASDATGTGVYGFSGASVPAAPAHVGVFGYTDTGYGIYARSGTATGTALYVDGKARFRRSGRSAVTSGHRSVAVTVSGVTTSSWVVATPQTNRSGVFVQAVVPSTNKITIYLNKTVTGTTYVGWLVVN
jgi:hypothetical protein